CKLWQRELGGDAGVIVTVDEGAEVFELVGQHCEGSLRARGRRARSDADEGAEVAIKAVGDALIDRQPLERRDGRKVEVDRQLAGGELLFRVFRGVEIS